MFVWTCWAFAEQIPTVNDSSASRDPTVSFARELRGGRLCSAGILRGAQAHRPEARSAHPTGLFRLLFRDQRRTGPVLHDGEPLGSPRSGTSAAGGDDATTPVLAVPSADSYPGGGTLLPGG